MDHRFLRAVVATLCLLTATTAEAAGVQLTSTVVRDQDDRKTDGQVTHRRVVATNVAPGDQVTYVIAYRNDDAKPVERAVLTNPVPTDLAFVSASSGGEVSVDGGKSFGSLTTLAVRAPNGTVRSAQPADVTHVRWHLAAAIAPGAAGEATFDARVK